MLPENKIFPFCSFVLLSEYLDMHQNSIRFVSLQPIYSKQSFL